MILNVSGRCDIVAFYTNWFMKRYEEGFVDVRNPFYRKSVSRIYFSDVDLIMFCTKNPLPIIKHLKDIDKPILFHVTLTPYKNDIEVNVIDKKRIIEGIKQISNILGKERIVVRYDPILINDCYTIDYHKKAFNKLCHELNGYIDTIVVSFIDEYKNVKKHKKEIRNQPFTCEVLKEIGLSFSKIASDNNIKVQTCNEENNLIEYGFTKGECISKELAFNLTGKKFPHWVARKSHNCKCAQMVDIGEYNSCYHLCKYCYANFDEELISENYKKHDENSSLLVGKIEKDDIIKIRR